MTDSTLSSFGFGEMIQGQVAIFSFLFSTMLYWGPFVLGYFGWKMWLYYRRAEWVSKMDWVMLEVRVPKEVNKTPLAMEVVLSSLYQSSRGVWWDWYWKGRVRDYFTIEMVSIEGDIHFFIRTRPFVRKNIENHACPN